MRAPYHRRLPSAGKLLALTGISLVASFVVMTLFSSSSDPIPTHPNVDVERFMGDWYVQGHIPLPTEQDAFNAVESYYRGADGEIQVVYAYRDGAFDAPISTTKPTGFVEGESGAEWGMRFIWPFKAEYLIAYVDEAYSETIVARSKRDYAWIMTREPEISEARYLELVNRLAALDYDVTDLRRVPQRWPDETHPAGRKRGSSLAERTYSE